MSDETPGEEHRFDPLAAFDIAGRVAIVTGASSGLGARFARVLAAAGARLVVTARRAERLDDLAAELPGTVAVAADVTADNAADAIMAAALDHHGRADILVNNAGMVTITPALDFDPGRFRREVEVDLVAPYALARAFAAHIIGRSGAGAVVNIGSVMGTVAGGKLRMPGYAAAKGGLHSLTRELASQWARKGVRVNALAPGWFETEMTGPSWNEDAFAAHVASSPMGRGGHLHELDGALLFLCSDASSFMTGQVLHVDGGWTIV